MWKERFRTLGSSLYRGVRICFVCFDVSDTGSFENAPMWIEEVGNVLFSCFFKSRKKGTVVTIHG